jgi:hypothetical protein
MDKMSHTTRDKQKLLTRVRHIRGQVEAIERALDGEAGCDQVMHLIASRDSFYRSVFAIVGLLLARTFGRLSRRSHRWRARGLRAPDDLGSRSVRQRLICSSWLAATRRITTNTMNEPKHRCQGALNDLCMRLSHGGRRRDLLAGR